MGKFEIYIMDTESTGLTSDHNIIEASFYRLSDDVQKTWYIRPFRYDNIEPDALRVNGHNLNDLKCLTKETRDKYKEPQVAAAEIENWVSEDAHASDERLLAGHNVAGFDKNMLMKFWKDCGSPETFPFSSRFVIDTMLIQVFLDAFGKTEPSEYYNLTACIQKYGLKKEKSHRSDSDTRMTKNLLMKQVEIIGSAFENTVRS